MEIIMIIIAVLFFLAAAAMGIDALRLQGKISEAWLVCICWTLLLCGFAIFMTVLMA